MEFATATAMNLPRLVFLLDEKTKGPRGLFYDRQYGHRQDDFRTRLKAAEIITADVDSPAQLETELYQSLTELQRDGGRGMNSDPESAMFVEQLHLYSLWEFFRNPSSSLVNVMFALADQVDLALDDIRSQVERERGVRLRVASRVRDTLCDWCSGDLYSGSDRKIGEVLESFFVDPLRRELLALEPPLPPVVLVSGIERGDDSVVRIQLTIPPIAMEE